MKKPISPQEALARLEELCSRSEQSSADARRRLLLWRIPRDKADEIIDSLIDNQFIDDSRFARAFVADKYRFSSWGRRKIRLGLMAKQIPVDIIESAMEVIDPRTYQLRAFAALKSKLRTAPADINPADLRQKLIRFGLSRGYESDLILRIIQSRALWTNQH